MKILFIHNYYRNTGGEDIYNSELLNLLKSKNHEIIYFTRDSKNFVNNFTAKAKIALKMFWNKEVEVELSQLIETNNPDIALISNIYPFISPTVYTVIKKYQIPIIQTIHNYRLICPNVTLFRSEKICGVCSKRKSYFSSILNGCYQKSRSASLVYCTSELAHRLTGSFNLIDKYLFPSSFARDFHLKRLSIDRRKTEVIANFIKKVKPTPNKKIEGDYFLFSGRFAQEKGIMPLLDLFARLPQINLIVIGDGPLKVKVNQYKKYSNIQIKNFMPRKKLYGYMKNALFSIIPSLWYEVLPMILIESFSQSTPVIVPQYGSFKSLVTDRKTGIFFEYGNFADLKNKILYLMGNKNLLFKMRKHAYREYRQKYTPEIHYKSLMKVYTSLIKK